MTNFVLNGKISILLEQRKLKSWAETEIKHVWRFLKMKHLKYETQINYNLDKFGSNQKTRTKIFDIKKQSITLMFVASFSYHLKPI